MAYLDEPLLREKTAAIERHLGRVLERLPESSEDFRAMTDASDAVILHLWQAVQAVIDLATRACIRLRLGAPQDYSEVFARLAGAGHLDPDLAMRLQQAAMVRKVVAQAEVDPDMGQIYRAATNGPEDLRSFLAALEKSI